jgi:S1-C subfamily serine protease
VGITCRRGERFTGTGTIIDPSGLILTSTTVVPRDAVEIKVYLRGGRELEGKLVTVREEKELSLIRIRAAMASKGHDYIPLGDSSRARVGGLALTLGNAFESIEDDDQVTLGQGLISGLYEITGADGAFESKYQGPVIETSAPLNGGMDGGPLLDREGRLIGLLSLAYSKNRWLGTAVPIDDLKPVIRSELALLEDGDDAFAAYAGLELEEVEGAGVRVRDVEPDGPLHRAGVMPGQWLRRVCGMPLVSLGEFRECFGKARPGERFSIEVSEERDGPPRAIEVDLWGAF